MRTLLCSTSIVMWMWHSGRLTLGCTLSSIVTREFCLRPSACWRSARRGRLMEPRDSAKPPS